MIRRTWWLALGLAAVVGCSSEPATDGTGGTAPPMPPANPPAVTEGPATAAPAPTAPADASTPAKPEEAPKAELPKPEEPAPPKSDESKTETPKGDEASATDVKLSPEEIAEINKLPEADRGPALAQKICPVSGGHLGEPEMGKPIKITLNGQDVFLCCGGCKKEAEKNADAILAKLNKKK